MTVPPVKSIHLVLGDELKEPFRPDVTVEWDAERSAVIVSNANGIQSALSNASLRDFYEEVGYYFLQGFRRLVSLSRVVDDSGYETPLEKDAAEYWGTER